MIVLSTHFHAKPLKRSAGKNAIAAAAYRAGQKLTDEATGKEFDYTRKQAVLATKIMAPNNAPSWITDRNRLWNEVERGEKRKDAQLARELEISLPAALSKEAQAALIFDFARDHFVSKGMVADIAIHSDTDGPNDHAHVMLTMRSIDETGFGQKVRDWNQNEVLDGWKDAWETACNEALERDEADVRVDRRSIADRREAALKAAEQATDWIEKRQYEIEAEELNYTPLPHLPQTPYRAMNEGRPIPEKWAEQVRAWQSADDSRTTARERALDMQSDLYSDIEAEERRREAQEAREAREAAQEAKEAAEALKEAEEAAEALKEAEAARKRSEGLVGRLSAKWTNIRENAALRASERAAKLFVSLYRQYTILADKWTSMCHAEPIHQVGYEEPEPTRERKTFERELNKLEQMQSQVVPATLSFQQIRSEQKNIKMLKSHVFPDLSRDYKLKDYWNKNVDSVVIDPRVRLLSSAADAPEHREERKAESQREWQAEKKKLEETARRSAAYEIELDRRLAEQRATREAERPQREAREREKYVEASMPLITRARTDPEFAKLITRWGIDLDRPDHEVARDDIWRMSCGKEYNGREVWLVVEADGYDLDVENKKRAAEKERADQQAKQEAPAPKPAAPKPAPKPSPYADYEPDSPGG